MLSSWGNVSSEKPLRCSADALTSVASYALPHQDVQAHGRPAERQRRQGKAETQVFVQRGRCGGAVEAAETLAANGPHG